jgi:hypothetical protein
MLIFYELEQLGQVNLSLVLLHAPDKHLPTPVQYRYIGYGLQ